MRLVNLVGLVMAVVMTRKPCGLSWLGLFPCRIDSLLHGENFGAKEVSRGLPSCLINRVAGPLNQVLDFSLVAVFGDAFVQKAFDCVDVGAQDGWWSDGGSAVVAAVIVGLQQGDVEDWMDAHCGGEVQSIGHWSYALEDLEGTAPAGIELGCGSIGAEAQVSGAEQNLGAYLEFGVLPLGVGVAGLSLLGILQVPLCRVDVSSQPG